MDPPARRKTGRITFTAPELRAFGLLGTTTRQDGTSGDADAESPASIDNGPYSCFPQLRDRHRWLRGYARLPATAPPGCTNPERWHGPINWLDPNVPLPLDTFPASILKQEGETQLQWLQRHRIWALRAAKTDPYNAPTYDYDAEIEQVTRCMTVLQ